MRFFEMKKLPNKIGRIKLCFSGKSAKIQNNAIILPEQSQLEFFKICRGTKFIVSHPYRNHSGVWETKYLFGGDDEATAFLKEITPNLWDDFLSDGEGEFLELLKPGIIRFLSTQLQQKHGRQGSVFTIKISDIDDHEKWDKVVKNLIEVLQTESCFIDREPREVHNVSIFGDHALNGKLMAMRIIEPIHHWTPPLRRSSIYLCTGILQHTSYKALPLLGIHLAVDSISELQSS